MQVERVDLYKYFGKERKGNQQGYLNVYIAEEPCTFEGQDRLRPAMLVIAGGGYKNVSKREKEPIAFEYLRRGFNVFILDYSTGEDCVYPTALLEGCMAMCYIRDNAEKLYVKKDKVACIGFSAGGHLTAMIHCLYNEQVVKDYLGEKAKLTRPDAVVLSYSVITSGKSSHAGSIKTISGGNLEIAKFLSMEKRVHKKVCPAFIWTTFGDGAVPMENSLLYAMAMRKKKVPFELMVFERGRHGLSVANETTANSSEAVVNRVSMWVDLSIGWLRERGFMMNCVNGE